MSNLVLFIVGTFVTLLVAGAMWIVVWAAMIDGRDEHERLRAEREQTRESKVRVA